MSARLLARSKPVARFRLAISMNLRLNAGALAGGVEGSLERRHRGFERIGGAVIGLAGLVDGSLGKGAHALRNCGVEAEGAEPFRHVAIVGAGLRGGSLGIISGGHELTSGGLDLRRLFAGWKAAGLERKGRSAC